MSAILDQLSQHISSFPEANVPDCQILDPDILSSSLQKSLRRAHLPCALLAAKGMIAADPRRFWRRLVTIVIEDFGLSDLTLTGQIIEAAVSCTWRMAWGGDLHVASYLLERLTLTPTDRRVDDIYMIGVAAHKHSEMSALINSATPSITRLVNISIELSKVCERPIPMHSFRVVVPKACDAHILKAVDTDPEIRILCVKARRISQCLLPVLLPSLLKEVGGAQKEYVLQTQSLPIASTAGILPVALDGYTSAGREILSSLVKSNKPFARVLAQADGISPVRSAAALLFCIEGGLLRNQLRDDLARELEQIGRGCWSGLCRKLIPDALHILREALPTIDARRHEFLENRMRHTECNQTRES